ncbi:MAG: tetratricopeptide repeat protein [Candidatus Brocadia sp.]|nr:tetratricopeptide repeat protein [Candidatus Brocadia sp.]
MPSGVQALIETRINDAVDRLREHNQFDLKKLAHDYVKKWRYWAFIATAFAILEPVASYLIAPQLIKKWVKDHVQQRMTEPMLKEAADEAIRTKMGQYVEEKVNPLKSEADDLSKRIEVLTTEISAKQNQIEKNQTSLHEQLHVQQLAVASKAGSRKDYEELKGIAASESELQIYARAALKEIELYFDADRNQRAYITLVESISRQNPGFSVEEVIDIYHNSGLQEAAVNVLYDLNRKMAVQELCDSLDSEQDLRVIARMTRTLEKLTGERFRPLDTDAVKAWWSINRSRSEYKSPYGGYLKALTLIRRGSLTGNDVKQIISLLDETIQADPEALHARCLRGFYLMLLGNYDKAEEEFKEVEKHNKDYRWLLLYEAILLVVQNKIDQAIELLNKALERSPSLEIVAKQLILSKELITNPKIKWPSEKTKQLMAIEK